MPSRVKPMHEKRWMARFPLLLISVSLHGLALLLLALFCPSGTSGNGISGTADGESFSAIWIPGDGRGPIKGGKGNGADNLVTDADDASGVENSKSVRIDKTENARPLLAVPQTDPQTVFNNDGSEALKIEEPEFVDLNAKTVAGVSHRTRPTPEESDSGNSNHSNASTIGKQSQSIASNSMESDEDDQAPNPGSGRGGTSGQGVGAKGSRGKGGNGVQFFGIVSRAKKVVYVIDASESMRQHNAMELARQNLLRSLQELTPNEQFQIIFFNLTNHTLTRPGERTKLLPANTSNLRLAKQLITGIQPDSGTDRLAAINLALSLEPDIIYLLTDADAPELTAKDLWDIRQSNKRKALIHVVEFGNGSDLTRDSFLKRLSRQNGGVHFYNDLNKTER